MPKATANGVAVSRMTPREGKLVRADNSGDNTSSRFIRQVSRK